MDGCRVSAAPRVRGQDAARSTRRKRSTASEVLQPAKQASKSSSQKSEAIRNDEPTLGKWTSQVVLEYMIPSSHPLVEMHRIRKSAGTAPPPPPKSPDSRDPAGRRLRSPPVPPPNRTAGNKQPPRIPSCLIASPARATTHIQSHLTPWQANLGAMADAPHGPAERVQHGCHARGSRGRRAQALSLG